MICSKQAELNQAESEVENSKRHLQHYEDKQREHMACIKKHKDLLVSKEKELEVHVVGFFFNCWSQMFVILLIFNNKSFHLYKIQTISMYSANLSVLSAMSCADYIKQVK